MSDPSDDPNRDKARPKDHEDKEDQGSYGDVMRGKLRVRRGPGRRIPGRQAPHRAPAKHR